MKIILTENQEKLLYKHILNEYMQDGFNLKTLYNMNPFDEDDGFYYPQKLRDYCVKYIGEPMNDGSSRQVFDLNDNRVLKLAYNKAGIEQNKVEYNIWTDSKSPLLPSILAHSREFAWIITEQVIPCNKTDFEKILGIPYDPAYLRHQKEYDKLERKQYKNYNNKKLPSNKEICYDGFIVFLSYFSRCAKIRFHTSLSCAVILSQSYSATNFAFISSVFLFLRINLALAFENFPIYSTASRV